MCQIPDRIFPGKFINAATQTHVNSQILIEGIIGHQKPIYQRSMDLQTPG